LVGRASLLQNAAGRGHAETARFSHAGVAGQPTPAHLCSVNSPCNPVIGPRSCAEGVGHPAVAKDCRQRGRTRTRPGGGSGSWGTRRCPRPGTVGLGGRKAVAPRDRAVEAQVPPASRDHALLAMTARTLLVLQQPRQSPRLELGERFTCAATLLAPSIRNFLRSAAKRRGTDWTLRRTGVAKWTVDEPVQVSGSPLWQEPADLP